MINKDSSLSNLTNGANNVARNLVAARQAAEESPAKPKSIPRKIIKKLADLGAMLRLAIDDPEEDVHLQALEPRVMYDASPLGAVIEEIQGPNADATELDPDLLGEISFDPSTDQHIADSVEQFAVVDDRQVTAAEPRELVFIDQRMANYQELVSDLGGTNFEVVLLDPQGDGIRQISDYLAGNNLFMLRPLFYRSHRSRKIPKSQIDSHKRINSSSSRNYASLRRTSGQFTVTESPIGKKAVLIFAQQRPGSF